MQNNDKKHGEALGEPGRITDDHLDFEAAVRFIDEILSAKKKITVVIAGGEPLLYKHFRELLLYLRSKKTPVQLESNGLLINENTQFLLENTTVIDINMFGTEEYHNEVNSICSFNSICEALEKLVQDKASLKKMFPVINVRMMISRFNYLNVKDFVIALRERFKGMNIVLESSKNTWLKPRDFSICFVPVPFTTEERGKQYETLMLEHMGCEVTGTWRGLVEDISNMELELLKNDLEELWNSEEIDYSNFVDIRHYFGQIENVFGRSRCLAPWHELSLYKNGDAYPCSDFPDYVLGNIYKSTFKDIWEGDAAGSFRELLKGCSLPVCNRCSRLFTHYW